MRRTVTFAIAVLVGMLMLTFSTTAAAQGRGAPGATATKRPWKFYPMDRADGAGGPAPKRDLTGTWAGPSSGMAVPRGDNVESPSAPPLTAYGKELFSLNLSLIHI